MILSDDITLAVVFYAVGAATGYVSAWLLDQFKTPPEDTP